MNEYIITINTNAYKSMRTSKKNWERGTINDFMEALNCYKVTERSINAVEGRRECSQGIWYTSVRILKLFTSGLMILKVRPKLHF